MADDKTLSDDDFLRMVAEERRASVGFDSDDDVQEERAKALEYAKGKMDDVPALANRSKAVSTDVQDAVETVLPDLVEIFTGGEDVAAFTPTGEEDEEAATQETEYLNHIVFQKNPGFLNFYSAFKDALLVKTGVWRFWWEDAEEVTEERYEGKSAIEYGIMREMPDIEIADVEEIELAPGVLPGLPMPTPEKIYNFTVRQTKQTGYARYRAVPPEDFAVARDTVWLPEATYCVARSRPRAQKLIEDGFDPKKVAMLPARPHTRDEDAEIARDVAGESEGDTGEADNLLREVEIYEHFLRVDADGDGKTEIWRVVTGADEKVLLEKEQCDQIEFAAITPYMTPHRFYGRSLADLLLEIQRIKTALLRMLLDSGYFAMNQRVEIAEQRMNENTISDYLRNEPGVPIRSQTGDAVKPIQAGNIGFDVAGALEYVSTMAEQRTGVVRNAQGLNPDTLHDTKGGMERLMTAAQRRIRMIARIFAETGVKDLYLGLHNLIRTHSSQSNVERLRGKWVPVDPTRWGNRSDMTIEVGLGSGGREQEIAFLRSVIEMQTQAIEMQGGADGPLVKPENIYAAIKRYCERGGIKAPELYFADPEQAEPQPPKPDPEMAKAQQSAQLEKYKADLDAQIARERIEREDALARDRMDREFAMSQAKLEMEARVRLATGAQKALSSTRPGGRIDA